MLTRRQLLASTAAALPLAAATLPLPLQSRRELFVDHYLIHSLTGAELRLAQPIDAGPAFQFDRPWEGRFCNYATVIPDAGKFRLYYRGVPNAGADGRGEEVYCYAESTDGTTFHRPSLQLHSVRGTDSNNVILADTPPLQHNFSPFLDTHPGVAPTSRYKGLAGTSKAASSPSTPPTAFAGPPSALNPFSPREPSTPKISPSGPTPNSSMSATTERSRKSVAPATAGSPAPSALTSSTGKSKAKSRSATRLPSISTPTKPAPISALRISISPSAPASSPVAE